MAFQRIDSSVTRQIGLSINETDNPRQAAKVDKANEKMVRES